MEKQHRVESHPILAIGRQESVSFYWNNQKVVARKGEMISSALFAAGIRVFGHHHRGGHPVGIFCANGQCSQCTVLANDTPVKSCVTEVQEGLRVMPCSGLPKLPKAKGEEAHPAFAPTQVLRTPVAIIGGGPAGLRAAIELANLNIRSVIVDDKANLGGKLVLQTHTFFGSVADCFAGTRGVDIAMRLENEAKTKSQITIMTSTQAVAVFSDHRIGVVTGDHYKLIEPEILLIATGAREKALSFPGCELPGVYGAGAFQTLVNRDLVRAGDKVFIVGGGNVGLIAGYHALQAQMVVTGLIEAMPKVSGYRVHKDKLARLGVPILLRHTILSANPNQDRTGVESATIAQVDDKFQPIAGTEKTVECDTILVAAGLSPCDEFHRQAKQFGMKVFMAGDAEEIAEASAAMFSGRIAAVKIANALGMNLEIPTSYAEKMEVLKSRPGKNVGREKDPEAATRKVYPVFHCFEEIPCNPCTTACSKHFITLKGESGTMMDLPYFTPEDGECSGCLKCVAVCPGLAISIVDKRRAPEGKAHVFLPFELIPPFKTGDQVETLDADGKVVGKATLVDVINKKWQDKTLLLKLEVSLAEAERVAGVQVQRDRNYIQGGAARPKVAREDNIVCRCEKVTDGEIRRVIREGATDVNALKVIRCSMGACGGKTCGPMVRRIFAEEGVDAKQLTEGTLRPLNAEVKLGTFANIETEKEPSYESDI